MSKNSWKKKKKKKDKRIVCQECIKIFDPYDIMEYLVESEIPHWSMCCTECAKKLPEGTEIKPHYKNKRKKKIDTTGWVEGKPTRKGNTRYIFIDEKGKEVTLLAETGIKKGLKPLIKKD